MLVGYYLLLIGRQKDRKAGMQTNMSREGLGKQPEHQDVDATCNYLGTL